MNPFSPTTMVGRAMKKFHPATICGQAFTFSILDEEDKDFLPEDSCIGVLANNVFVKSYGRFWKRNRRLFLGVIYFNKDRSPKVICDEWVFEVYGGNKHLSIARNLADKIINDETIKKHLAVKRIGVALSIFYREPQGEVFGARD